MGTLLLNKLILINPHIHFDFYPSTVGKLSHIESAAKYFYKLNKIKIKPHQVVLFDDDEENIRLAKKYSIRTVRVVDNNTLPSLL